MTEYVNSDKKLQFIIHEEVPEIKTFVLNGEDYTFGNILIYILQRFPETEFCACTIGHPDDNAIYLRIKVKPGECPTQTFEKALKGIKSMLSVVKSNFNEAMENYNQSVESISPCEYSNYKPAYFSKNH